MTPKFVLLPTDIVIVVLLAALTFYLIHVARLRRAQSTLALCCKFRVPRFARFRCCVSFSCSPS